MAKYTLMCIACHVQYTPFTHILLFLHLLNIHIYTYTLQYTPYLTLLLPMYRYLPEGVNGDPQVQAAALAAVQSSAGAGQLP